ncbi:hypothetical protein AAMO2058_001521500 [Amorphochlora amoebiformis]|uniref:Uncharacterized protein n=2 Tax=Amorphochlora amoebiformis TaxID=1561963 RepID=A0A7S0CNU1_9EUKA|mmetsp:Transcript_10561/g.16709  ORF Transcript_10561/g.16709 Transcript_10561/m.16709 type:complete len:162 (+) Transcript_10561:190-675(+)
MVKFPKRYVMTNGLDLKVKMVRIPDSTSTVELYLFDTGGHPAYDSLHKKCWAGSSMVMVVFDMANQSSFESAKKWLQEYQKAIFPLSVKGVVVGTKADLKQSNSIMVNPNSVLDFANEHKLRYFETSAKETQGIDDPFHFIAGSFYSSYVEEVKQITNSDA